MSRYRYPQAPSNVAEQILEPSTEFKKEIRGVIGAINKFIFTYIILLILAFALVVLCTLAGIAVINLLPSLITLVLGIGLIGVSFIVLYFLFKFMFRKKETDRSGMREIYETEHPSLFEFLRKVAAETHAPMPKRVFLSPDVQAFVFYDSTFWSMFLPIRKNLNIGLGLVNTVNLTEFKAIVAHEFGHFSQKSMKLGSYVYNVNHIIYDMLYNNYDYRQTLNRFAEVTYVFRLCAEVASKIIEGIQSVLEEQYENVNERYMALSRQMEYHADTVAASVSGTALINALYRLDVAQVCYNSLLGYYDMWIKQNKKGSNAYSDLSVLMDDYIRYHNLNVVNGRADVDSNSFVRFGQSRINISNQWASHPDNVSRENHIRSLDLMSQTIHDSPWVLFENAEGLQHKTTETLYKTVVFSTPPEVISPDQFHSMFQEHKKVYSYHEGYKGYYDARTIMPFDPVTISQQPVNAQHVSEILTESNINIRYRVDALSNDIEMLEQIQMRVIKVKTFDFDGKKYQSNDARTILETLKGELEETKKAQSEVDHEVFRLFFKKASHQENDNEAITLYKRMFELADVEERNQEEARSVLNDLYRLLHSEVSHEKALAETERLIRQVDPIKLKIRIRLSDSNMPHANDEEKGILRSFIEDKQSLFYFKVGYNDKAISLLIEALNIYGKVLSEYVFGVRKKVLDRQMEVLAQ